MTKKKGLFRRISGIDEISKNFKFTKSLIEKSKKESKKEFVSESFEDAIQRLNIEEKDLDSFLDEKYKQIRINSLISYSFFLIIFLINIINFINNGSIFYFITFSLISFYFFINGFTMAFRCYQIKNKKLQGLLKGFAKKNSEWIPKKNRNMEK